MKISISNIAWENEYDLAVADILSNNGIHGIDIAYTKIWPSLSAASAEAVNHYRSFWNSRNINVIGMQSLIYGRPDLLLFGGHEVRKKMMKYLIDVFELAAQLGAVPLVFGSPKNRLRGELS